jgi:zinc protease
MDPLGTKKNISKIKRTDIIKKYKQLCRPDNMVISVFGDIDKNKIKDKVITSFGNLKNPSPMPSYPIFKRKPEVIKIKKKVNKKQTLILLGFPGVKVSNPDRYIMDTITNTLSGLRGRLYYNIREEKGIAYYVGTYQILGLAGGMYVFYAGTEYKNIEVVRKGIWEEIKKLKNEKIPEEELKGIKNKMIADKLLNMQTNSALSFEYGLNELYGLEHDNFKKYEKIIKSITATDIQKTVKKYFDENDYVEVVVHPETKTKNLNRRER